MARIVFASDHNMKAGYLQEAVSIRLARWAALLG